MKLLLLLNLSCTTCKSVKYCYYQKEVLVNIGTLLLPESKIRVMSTIVKLKHSLLHSKYKIDFIEVHV